MRKWERLHNKWAALGLEARVSFRQLNMKRSQELLINQRFCALCIALELTARDEGSEAFYKKLLRSKRLRALISKDCELRDGSVQITTRVGAGPAKTLANEFSGKSGKRDLMQPHIAVESVRRLLGFVRYGDGWTLLPRRGGARKSKDGESRHRWSYGIVPARIRTRIFDVWEAAPQLLENYVEEAIAYLVHEEAEDLPVPPWNRPLEFENAHGFILSFFDRVKSAHSNITVVAVDAYITAAIGHEAFTNALKQGVRVRFLIFDFLHRSAGRVARMIGRSEQAFYASVTDTVEALLKLRGEAKAIGKHDLLEIRLADKDPAGRWYIIDAPAQPGVPEPMAFVARRTAGEPSKAAAARGGIARLEDIPAHVATVDQLWADARELNEEWLGEYKAWKAKPKTQRLLGPTNKGAQR